MARRLRQFLKSTYIMGLILCAFMGPGCGNNSSSASPDHSAGAVEARAGQKQRNFTIGNGVNLQPSYYNQGQVDFAWRLMRSKSKIKTVRLEIEPDAVDQAVHWIRAASREGYTVIATYHQAQSLGSDDPAEVQQAARWWTTSYPLFVAALPKNQSGLTDSSQLLINLINEWGSHHMRPAQYAAAYNAAITTIRKYYSGYIIIDIPGWGQETYTAYQASKTTRPHLLDPKIVLSAHIYAADYNQAKRHPLQPADLDDLKNTGYPCMIGEFGTGSEPGGCNWAACVNYAKKLGWPVVAWCWNGDGGSMNMLAPSWAKTATATIFTTTPYFDTVYSQL